MRYAGMLVVGAMVVTAGCSGTDASEAEAPTGPQVIEVQAGDFYFTAPDTIEAGLTTFHMEMTGQEFHHIYAVRLEQGRTVEELMRVLDTTEVLPAWAVSVGGPNTMLPGEHSAATMDLAPGSYALICAIPSSDGVPHMRKGMFRPLTVVPRSGPKAPAPEHDAVMVLDDYSFTTTPAIAAGTRTIRFENNASQPHEAVVFQLAPGKTVQDMLQWLGSQEGPPPGRPFAGITPISRGEVNYMTFDFAPGDYGLICFIADEGDHRPHFVHGMVAQFTVE